MKNHDDLTPEESIPLGTKIAYGCADTTGVLMMFAYQIYFLIFMTDVVDGSAAAAGIILFLSHIFDAFTDPGMGIVSNRTKSRFGRRRPYMIGSVVPLCLIFWLLFSVPPLGGSALIAYYVIISILFIAAMTGLLVPYTALAPEMASDYNERTSLIGFRAIFFQVGAIIAAVAMLLISKQFSDPKIGWSVAAAILGSFSLIPVLVSCRVTRGWEKFPEDTERLSFKEVLSAVLGNRPFPVRDWNLPVCQRFRNGNKHCVNVLFQIPYQYDRRADWVVFRYPFRVSYSLGSANNGSFKPDR